MLHIDPGGDVERLEILEIGRRVSRWQLKYLFIFIPKIGEDAPMLTHIFQMGWNHQLDFVRLFVVSRNLRYTFWDRDHNRHFGMPNWPYECCLISCSERKTSFSCRLPASLARFNLLLECISSRPEAMDVLDRRGAVLSSLIWLMSSHVWLCIKGLVNEGIVNFLWWLSIWLALWRNEIASPIGGFMALLVQELSSLADLVVSKGLTQDGDEGGHLCATEVDATCFLWGGGQSDIP